MKLSLSLLISDLLQSAMLLRLIKVAFLLTIVFPCLFEFILHRESKAFRELEVVLLSPHWMLLFCLAIWCGSFIFLTFSLKDLPLIGLLLTAFAAYLMSYAPFWRRTDAIVFLAGVTLGKGTQFLLQCGTRNAERENGAGIVIFHSSLVTFLFGLVGLLVFASWWHLDMSYSFYHEPRWMGLWDNPNVYGMLMCAGVLLATELITGIMKEECRKKKQIRYARSLSFRVILYVAAGMMTAGLFFSYSRGAWFGAAIGFLYLAKAHEKFKWRFVLPGVFVVAAVVYFFWHSTAENCAWYLKRLDLSRPSAQHRVAAWLGAVQMVRDHPLGVGWNEAVETYEKNYSPPENGVAAIMTNDYLMLGTQLGLPSLLCFVAYVALCFRKKLESGKTRCPALACRAGALAMLVAFWFDGGLFYLPTAAVFWILLELGSSEMGVDRREIGARNVESGHAEIHQKYGREESCPKTYP